MTSDNATKRNHWMTVKKSLQSLQFELRACENARLTLARLPFTDPLYEISLGTEGNTRSVISRYTNGVSTVVAQEDTPGIIDCLETRRFYLSWNNGIIQLVRGTASGRRLMDWQDNEPLGAYSVSLTTGPGSSGMWTYNSDQGGY